MKTLIKAAAFLMLTGCNYITMTHVGEGSGAVDETPTLNTTVDPDVTIPVSAIPSTPKIPKL